MGNSLYGSRSSSTQESVCPKRIVGQINPVQLLFLEGMDIYRLSFYCRLGSEPHFMRGWSA